MRICLFFQIKCLLKFFFQLSAQEILFLTISYYHSSKNVQTFYFLFIYLSPNCCPCDLLISHPVHPGHLSIFISVTSDEDTIMSVRHHNRLVMSHPSHPVCSNAISESCQLHLWCHLAAKSSMNLRLVKKTIRCYIFSLILCDT